MSRRKHKTAKQRKKNNSKSKPAFGIKFNRRSLMKLATLAIIAMPVYAVVSAYSNHQQKIHDLSIIGQGKPVLVQAHDVTCPKCRTLLSSVESVIDEFPNVEFKIADLKSKEGLRFSSKHNANKVTLMFFDAKGNRVNIESGLQTEDEVRSFIYKSS